MFVTFQKTSMMDSGWRFVVMSDGDNADNISVKTRLKLIQVVHVFVLIYCSGSDFNHRGEDGAENQTLRSQVCLLTCGHELQVITLDFSLHHD